MDNKNKNKQHVNIYWEDIPSKENALRDVLSFEDYQNPGKVLNSTFVEVEGKPWLKHPTSQNKKPIKSIKTDKSKLRVSPVKADVKSKHLGTNATLRDLRKEDKQKVANLIKELAKFGEEKENAFELLNQATAEFQARINTYELERQDAIKRYDELKEQLLEYEIQCKVNQGFNVDGNLKSNSNTFSKSNSQNENNFEGIFLEQQIKFKQQQQILQQQIDQLQKLQESILLKQDKGDFVHSEALQDYGQVQQLSKGPEGFQKTNEHENNSLHNSKNHQSPKVYVHQDTQTITDSTKMPTTENNMISNQQKTVNFSECSVSTPRDVCIQTENFSSDIILGSQRLLQCEKSISLLEQSLTSMSARSNCHSRCSFKDKIEKVSIHTKSSKNENSKSFTQTQSILATSEKCLSAKRKAKQKNSIDMIDFLLNEQSSSESDGDLPSSTFPSPLVNPSSKQFTSSAVKRKHFQPSSMIDLVEGLQPRSTSTSVDQHSLHKNNLVEQHSLHKNNLVDQRSLYKNTKSGRRGGRTIHFEQRRLGKIYGNQNAYKSSKTEEDEMDEEDVLEDVFFI